MIKQELSSYLSGLTNISSSISKDIGPSYIEVDCFDKDNFKEEFCKYYNISKDKLEYKESNRKLEDVLNEWLNNNELVNSLIYWIKLRIGEPIKVYETDDSNIEELISGYSNSISPFYITEEIVYVEFKDYIACFMIGNNE